MKNYAASAFQATVLDPKLFLLYTHVFPCSDEAQVVTFSNDAAFTMGKHFQQATIKLQKAIHNIVEATRKAKLNESKSTYINFTKEKSNHLKLSSMRICIDLRIPMVSEVIKGLVSVPKEKMTYS